MTSETNRATNVSLGKSRTFIMLQQSTTKTKTNQLLVCELLELESE